jgi:hypothetical protein
MTIVVNTLFGATCQHTVFGRPSTIARRDCLADEIGANGPLWRSV